MGQREGNNSTNTYCVTGPARGTGTHEFSSYFHNKVGDISVYFIHKHRSLGAGGGKDQLKAARPAETWLSEAESLFLPLCGPGTDKQPTWFSETPTRTQLLNWLSGKGWFRLNYWPDNQWNARNVSKNMCEFNGEANPLLRPKADVEGPSDR